MMRAPSTGAGVSACKVHRPRFANDDHFDLSRILQLRLDATRDPETPDGAAIPVELRPARDLSAYLADVPVRASDALVPAADVIPADAIDAFITETVPVGPADGTAG